MGRPEVSSGLGGGGGVGGGGRGKRCSISVKGMTCNSCVQNIQGVISDKPGVLDISVSLAKEEADVRYDAALTSPQAVADAIDDVCCPCQKASHGVQYACPLQRNLVACLLQLSDPHLIADLCA